MGSDSFRKEGFAIVCHLFSQANHRALHCSHQHSVSVRLQAKYIRPNDGQGLAGFDYFRVRDKRLASRRPQQIDLELDAQDVRAGGHQSKGSVTTG